MQLEPGLRPRLRGGLEQDTRPAGAAPRRTLGQPAATPLQHAGGHQQRRPRSCESFSLLQVAFGDDLCVRIPSGERLGGVRGHSEGFSCPSLLRDASKVAASPLEVSSLA